MSNNVPYQSSILASPSPSTIVETIDEGSGVERQVICLGSVGKAGSETQLIGINPNADGLSTATTTLLTSTGFSYIFDGAGWNRERGQVDLVGSQFTLSAVGAGTYGSTFFRNYNGRGGTFYFNVTVVSGGSTVTFTIQTLDPASGTTLNLLSTTAIAAPGLTTLTIYPNIASAANSTLNFPLPRLTQVQAVVAGAGVVTATTGVSFFL